MKMNETPVFKTFIDYLDSHKEKKMVRDSEYIGLVMSINNNYNEIFIPIEDRKNVGCCWRCLCPCYYIFCCCCCCE